MAGEEVEGLQVKQPAASSVVSSASIMQGRLNMTWVGKGEAAATFRCDNAAASAHRRAGHVQLEAECCGGVGVLIFDV